MRWTFEHEMIVRRFGDGPELVWIHGLGDWSPSIDVCARQPALADFTHVLPDLPGYGRSPWPEPVPAGTSSLDRLADHLASWLQPRPAVVLAGHSMGGVLATLVAERIAVRAVVDLDGNLSRGDCTFSAQAIAYSPGDFASHGFAAMRDQVYALGATDTALRGYLAGLSAASPAAFHRNAADLVELSVSETLAPRLAAVRCPALFIAGVPDGICERSRRLLDQHAIRWVAIEPAGHWVFVDQPAAVAAAMAAFLRDS